MNPADDAHWMSRALVLASRLRGATRPNPSVACVLVRDGRVVGEGVTQPPGRAHAEVMALRDAGGAADGATAYVTLEPCNHHGRTPPCTEALIAAGIERAVFGAADPNPLAAGGRARLTAADVTVQGDCLREWSVELNREFLCGIVHPDRPYMLLKLAQTIDGRLMPDEGRWITGPSARRVVHQRRARADGVLVGSGTVLSDDPRLDVRGVAVDAQPRPIVLDGRGRTPSEAHVVRPGAVVLTSSASPVRWRQDLAGRGVHVEVIERTGSVLDLHQAMAALRALGVLRVFAEPGGELSPALVMAGLVDEYVQHVAVGSALPAAIGPVPGLGATTTWPVRSWRRLGRDIEIVRRPPSSTGRAITGAEEAS